MRGFLNELHGRLAELSGKSRRRAAYRVPRRWNAWGFPHARTISRSEIQVDPVDFILDCLDRVILPRTGGRRLGARSLSKSRGVEAVAPNTVLDNGHRRRAGDWITRAGAYSLIIRHTTAWDHNGDGTLRAAATTETGTFLKTILLLPFLERMGVNLLYLLPVSKCSRAFRKGELGCPYSAKNFFELEPDLHDRLLGRDSEDVGLEFGAFVEAAHALDMRVMIDLAPRTASRDSDLILDHPDWFYWIDRKRAAGFKAPHIPGFEGFIPTPKELREILRLDCMQPHLACFRHDPKRADPDRWKRFATQCRSNPPKDLLASIGREFGVTTSPSFSDCINDPQTPWSDVTFLRLYRDHPAASVRHIPGTASHPPYVFTDTIKASRFPGKKPNTPLWNMLASVLPFYQRFGVDGARVDMGHALPPALQRRIVDRARGVDPDFCLLAEQFDHDAAGSAKREGFNAIIGSSWSMLPRASEGQTHRYIQEVLPRTALVSLAAPETPDTPRATVRDGGIAFAEASAVLIHFLPRAIPFINSGFELLERQPMSLGLDIAPPGRFALPKTDLYYGKLAYFDRVAMHWLDRPATGMIELIRRSAEVRREFLDDLVDPGNVFFPRVTANARYVVVVGWRIRQGRSAIIVTANTDWKHSRRVTVQGLPAAVRRRRSCTVLVETHCGPPPKRSGAKLAALLPSGGVKVILL